LTLAYVDEHGEAGLDGLVLSDGFDAYDDNAERSVARLATLAAEAAQSVDEDDAAEGDDAASWRAVERFARDEADAGAPYPLSTIVEASEACARLEAQLDRPEPAEPEPAGLGAVTSPLVVPEGLLVTWNFRTMITELMTFDRSASVAARRLPALLVWGESDCRVPVATGESLRARYGGDARLAVISGATHFALYSQPQAFATPTIEFLEELP
jgi:pimeloyl-ACP methyl ester carboxylesterase